MRNILLLILIAAFLSGGAFAGDANLLDNSVNKLDNGAQVIPDPNVILQGGDNCADFFELTGNLPITSTGTTSGYGNDYGPYSSEPNCWQGSFYASSGGAADVVYKFTAPMDGVYTFSLCGSTYDTNLELYYFTCPDEPTIDDFICGNDDACGLQSELVDIALNLNDEILVVVDGYGTANGNYTLTITGDMPPVGACCVDLDCVGDMEEQDCANQGGSWYIGQSCSNFNCPEPPAETCTDASFFDNEPADLVNGVRPAANWDPLGVLEDFDLSIASDITCMRAEFIEGTTPLGEPSNIESARIRIYDAPNGTHALRWNTDGENPVFDHTFSKINGDMDETDSDMDAFGRDLVYFDFCGETISLEAGNYGVFITFPGRGGEDFFWASTSNSHGNLESAIWGTTINEPSPSGIGEMSFHFGVGTCGMVGIEENSIQIPEQISLIQNYPNPFNASTILTYNVTEPGNVKLNVFNLLGQNVKTLVNKFHDAGEYTITWKADDMPSGLYFARLETSGTSSSVMMMLLK